MHKIKKLSADQRGFASMVIALVLVLVLALMTIGFAQLARREQQKSLDKQLAVQATYAAESAINDAINDIKRNNGAIPANSNGQTCIRPGVGDTSKPTIDPTSGASYSCLLVNLAPLSLIKSPLDADSAWNIAFSTSAPLGNLKVTWTSHYNHNTPKLAYIFNKLSPASAWGTSPGVLQFSITPLTVATRDGLSNGMFTTYMYPSGAVLESLTNTATYAAAPSPLNTVLRSGRCTPAGVCNVTINMGALSSVGPYLVHIYNYYDASDVTLTGTALLGGTAVNFANGQAQIDATGKAKNVLKRLQARVPLNGLLGLPNYAIEGQDVCKRFTTGPAPLTSSVDPASDPAACGF